MMVKKIFNEVANFSLSLRKSEVGNVAIANMRGTIGKSGGNDLIFKF